jgi:hypothetical protein
MLYLNVNNEHFKSVVSYIHVNKDKNRRYANSG